MPPLRVRCPAMFIGEFSNRQHTEPFGSGMPRVFFLPMTHSPCWVEPTPPAGPSADSSTKLEI